MNKIKHLEIVSDLCYKLNEIYSLIEEENYKSQNIKILINELKKNKNIKIEDITVDKSISESYNVIYEYLKIQLYQYKGIEEKDKKEIKIINYGFNFEFYD